MTELLPQDIAQEKVCLGVDSVFVAVLLVLVLSPSRLRIAFCAAGGRDSKGTFAILLRSIRRGETLGNRDIISEIMSHGQTRY
jgi:hypothetical protein